MRLVELETSIPPTFDREANRKFSIRCTTCYISGPEYQSNQEKLILRKAWKVNLRIVSFAIAACCVLVLAAGHDGGR